MATIKYNSRTYYINKLPKDVLGHKSRTEYMMAKNKINMFYRKNIPSNFMPHIRSLFSKNISYDNDFSENSVLTINDCYTIKSVVDSDTVCFRSEVYGEKGKGVIIKHSFNIEDVIITGDEIEYLVVNTLSDNDKTARDRVMIEKTINYIITVKERGYYTASDMKPIKAGMKFYRKMFDSIISKDRDNFSDIVFSKHYDNETAVQLYIEFFNYREKLS